MNVDEKDVLLMSLTGLVSLDSQEDVVVKGIGLSRGDKRRNGRLARLRVLVPAENAILGIDLADTKQAVVVTDHDSQVLARGPVTAKAWELGPVLDWARKVAHAHGFADVTVGCEPTGHRWRVLDQLAAQHDMALVCVQPLLTGQARQAEDYTSDKRDDKDAVLIARLVAQLHCYAPERAEETWAQLRQLGARRDELVTQAIRCVQQLRDLLECAWRRCWVRRGHRLTPPTGVPRWRWFWSAVMVTRDGWPGGAQSGSPPRCAASCPAGVVNGCGGASSARSSLRSRIRPG